jgi:hypothetical protein
MKKKLTLELDQLGVESFDTGAAPLPRGTVRGRDYTLEVTCKPALCDDSSVGTCDSDCQCPTGFSDCQYVHSCGSDCVWSVCQYSCQGSCATCETLDCCT